MSEVSVAFVHELCSLSPFPTLNTDPQSEQSVYVCVMRKCACVTKWELRTASHIPQTRAALERRQRRKSLTDCGTSPIPSEWKVRRAVRLAKSHLSLPPKAPPITFTRTRGQPSTSDSVSRAACQKIKDNNPRPALVSSSDAPVCVFCYFLLPDGGAAHSPSIRLYGVCS